MCLFSNVFMKQVSLDGKSHSGSGCIVRLGLALAAITRKEVVIDSVRSSRKRPGVNHQILAAIKLLKNGTNAYVEGAVLGSSKIFFSPTKPFSNKRMSVDVGTAGATSLVFQSLALPMLFSGEKSNLVIRGGTHVPCAPSFEYMKEIFIRYLGLYAKETSAKEHAIGFVPKGGGEVEVNIRGKYTTDNGRVPPFGLTYHKKLVAIKGVLTSSRDYVKSGLPEKVIELLQLSFASNDIATSFVPKYVISESQGLSIDIFAYFGNEGNFDNDIPYVIGHSLLPPKDFNISPNRFQSVVLDFIQEFKAKIKNDGVDIFAADQLIPLIGLVGGEVVVQKVTDHVKAAIYVCEKMLEVEFKIDGNTVSCSKGYMQEGKEDLPFLDDL